MLWHTAAINLRKINKHISCYYMKEGVFETQVFLREIHEDEGKRNEFLKDILVSKALVTLDYNDVKSVLTCEGQMVINKVEAESFKTALELSLNHTQIEKDVILNAKKLLLSISMKHNACLLLEEMGIVRDFLRLFKNCTEARWGMSINATQTPNVSVTLWAVGL